MVYIYINISLDIPRWEFARWTDSSCGCSSLFFQFGASQVEVWSPLCSPGTIAESSATPVVAWQDLPMSWVAKEEMGREEFLYVIKPETEMSGFGVLENGSLY